MHVTSDSISEVSKVNYSLYAYNVCKQSYLVKDVISCMVSYLITRIRTRCKYFN